MLVLHGPNLNLLGRREPEVYGTQTLEGIDTDLRALGAELGIGVDCAQHNGEGELVTAIGQAVGRYDGLVINPAAYTHTSVAIRDALAAVGGMGVPAVEVHLSQPAAREAFRHRSLVADVCRGSIAGFGPIGYLLALRGLGGLLQAGGGR